MNVDPITATDGDMGVMRVAEPENKNDYAMMENDLKEMQTRTLKAKKIAIGVLTTFGAILVAAAATAIVFKVSVAVVSTVSILTAITALYIFSKRNQTINNLLRSFYDTFFTQLLDAEDGKLTPEKLALFEKYGQYCRQLDFGNRFEIGIELGEFYQKLIDKTKNENIKAKLIEANKSDLQKNFISCQQPSLSVLNDVIGEVEKGLKESYDKIETEHLGKIEKAIGEVYTFATGNKNNRPLYSPNDLITPEPIVQLLKACPNLQTLEIGYCVDPKVIEAASHVKNLRFDRIPSFIPIRPEDITRVENLTFEKPVSEQLRTVIDSIYEFVSPTGLTNALGSENSIFRRKKTVAKEKDSTTPPAAAAAPAVTSSAAAAVAAVAAAAPAAAIAVATAAPAVSAVDTKRNS